MVARPRPAPAGCIVFLIPCPPDATDQERRPAAFELEIPLAHLRQVVFRPVRWLRLVAWGALNCGGRVVDAQCVPLDDDLHIDHLQGNATYRFVPEQESSCGLVNLEHVRTKRSRHSHSTSRSSLSLSSISTNSSYDSGRGREDRILAARDGGHCVFSGDSPIEKAHILPRRFAELPDNLATLASARGFAIEGHLDARNRLSVTGGIHTILDEKEQCFILATDPAFIRDEDVPQPQGPALGNSVWLSRPSPSGETYIMQAIDGHLDAASNLRRHVRFNERARFASATPESRPCVRVVNYVYAARMIAMYRRQRADVERVLWRPIPTRSSRPDEPPSSSTHDDQGDGPAHKRRKVGSPSKPAAAGKTSAAQTTGKRRRPHTPTDLDRFFRFSLSAAQKEVEQLEQYEADAKMDWVRGWRDDLSRSRRASRRF